MMHFTSCECLSVYPLENNVKVEQSCFRIFLPNLKFSPVYTFVCLVDVLR